MKYLFNFKLYLEGLKKIRLVGIIAGIIILISNALPPLVTLLNSRNPMPYDTVQSATVLTASNFATPSLLLLFLTPFFFFSMYSYLNKRNESDFYHAIPYKRSCVLLTFLASIYTWIWGLLLLSLLFTGLLWAVCPNVTFAFGVIPQLFGVYAATALYIGSFILLAMTLTGTIVSNIAVSGILLFIVRIVGTIVTLILDDIVYILDIAYTPLRFLSMRYWLPASIFSSFYDAAVFKNAALWGYSFVVLIVLYGLAIFCYCRRKSESANKSAPNRKLQHVFRCAFTLPLAMLTAYAMAAGEEASFVVVLLIITLVIYYLYELITTKNLRSTLRATPLLLVPFLCCALIIGGCFLTRSAVLESDYEPDDIASVRMYNYSSLFDLFLRGTNSYETLATKEIRISDREAAELVAEALKNSIRESKGENPFQWGKDDLTGAHVEITLQSGRRVGRYITFKSDAYKELQAVIQRSEEYRKAYITLPDSKYVQTVYAPQCDGASNADMLRLWETFAKEYGALSDDEKVEYKNRYRRINSYGEYILDFGGESKEGTLTSQLFLNVQGAIGADTFETIYYLPETFTETRAVYFELGAAARSDARDFLTDFAEGKYDDELMNDSEYHWLDLSYDGVCNGTRLVLAYSTGSYDLAYSEDSLGTQIMRNNYERQKDLAKRLLPYLTDTPAEDNYFIIGLSHDFYDEKANYRYHHKAAQFGLSELPEDLQAELALGGYTVDPELFFDVMRSYANDELSYLVWETADYDYYDTIFDLSLDGIPGLPNNYVETVVNYRGTNTDGFKSRYEASKALCTLLLTHLRTEVSEDAPACTLSLGVYDNQGYWVGIDTQCGLVPFEEDDLAKLKDLIGKIGNIY